MRPLFHLLNRAAVLHNRFVASLVRGYLFYLEADLHLSISSVRQNKCDIIRQDTFVNWFDTKQAMKVPLLVLLEYRF